MTGHNEVVRVVYDPATVSFDDLLQVFWESHDPTQGMQQGNDRGTQYRSGIYYYNETQKTAAQTAQQKYQERLTQNNYSAITTEIVQRPSFITPRIITSNIWPGTPGVIADWVEPV